MRDGSHGPKLCVPTTDDNPFFPAPTPSATLDLAGLASLLAACIVSAADVTAGMMAAAYTSRPSNLSRSRCRGEVIRIG